MANMELIASIRRTELDIAETRERIKQLNDARKDNVADMEEHRRVEELKADLKEARKMLKAAIKDDRDVAIIDADLDETKFKLKDLKEILSAHLVAYREETKATDIQEDDSKKVRPIVVTAKLGKAEYKQEALDFTGDVEVSGPDGGIIHRSPDAQARHDANVAAGAKHGLSETEVRIATSEPATMEEAVQNAKDLLADRKKRTKGAK